MSVSTYTVTVTARSDDGDYAEFKVSGVTEALTDERVAQLKIGAAETFIWAFDRDPDHVEVHDAMRFRAERPGEEGYEDA